MGLKWKEIGKLPSIEITFVNEAEFSVRSGAAMATLPGKWWAEAGAAGAAGDVGALGAGPHGGGDHMGEGPHGGGARACVPRRHHSRERESAYGGPSAASPNPAASSEMGHRGASHGEVQKWGSAVSELQPLPLPPSAGCGLRPAFLSALHGLPLAPPCSPPGRSVCVSPEGGGASHPQGLRQELPRGRSVERWPQPSSAAEGGRPRPGCLALCP